MTLSQDFEDSFTTDPPHRALDDRLKAGRAALRRRRIAASALAAAAVVAIGTTTYAVAGGDGGASRSIDPADAQDNSQVQPNQDPSNPPVADDPMAEWRDGEVILAAGVTEDDRVNNPMGYAPGEGTSVGLALTRGDEHVFMLLTEEEGKVEGESIGSELTAAATGGTLKQWLAGAVVNMRGLGEEDAEPTGKASTNPNEWLSYGHASLVAGKGVEIVDSRFDVKLGDSFAGSNDLTSAAKLKVDGKVQFVAVRQIAGQDIEVIPAGRGFADLDAFIDWSRNQYTEGEEGLR